MGEPAGNDAPANVQAGNGWSAVIEDMEATAAEYRERGWTTLELHPGDSVLVDSDRRTGEDNIEAGPAVRVHEDGIARVEFERRPAALPVLRRGRFHVFDDR
ncbi:hypothetical protein DJ71_05205 [Halorubrum sp. E3]|nr:hypothetical protein DJ71_05205 [Halorubrum sp. E3]